MPGIEVVVLIIDDGSTDRTVEVARELGVDHVVRLSGNEGWRRLPGRPRAALKLGADIVVNTDADNQYNAADIPGSIAPILAQSADIVVGDPADRQHRALLAAQEAPPTPRQRVVRRASQTDLRDATSGFRAYSREAALRLTVVTNFTYTVETIIQASQQNLAVTHVPIRTNGKLRESRLFSL